MFTSENTHEDDTYWKKVSNTHISQSKIFYGSFSEKPSVFWRRDSDEKKTKRSTSFTTSTTDEGENIPEITAWRRAMTEDKPAIKKLQTLTGNAANLLYRKRNIDDLIEKSFFPVVQLDSKGELISFTAYDSFPNIPSVPSFFWTDWLKSIYKINGATSRNVLFVHYMVWRPQQANRFLGLLLQTAFSEFIHLNHIIIIKPPKTNVPEFYTKHFIPVRPYGLEMLEFDSIQTLLVCLRTSIIQPLPIRTAFQEDIEVIMSIINHQLDSFKKITEITDREILDFTEFLYKQEKKSLICELEGNIAGIMILNQKLDLEALGQEFELGPFHGLRKKDLDDEDSNESEQTRVLPQSSLRFTDRPTALISSEYLFSQMKMELMLNDLKIADSSIQWDENSENASSDSDFSGFSLITGSSESSPIISEQVHENSVDVHSPRKYEFHGDVKVSIRTPVTTSSHYFLPNYRGYPDAFAIDFFAIDCSRLEEKLTIREFLKAAFRVIPDKEYCALIIPTDSVPGSLLDLFVRVTPKPLSSVKLELYLCHRSTLSSALMNVRDTTKEDLNAISAFLEGVPESNTIFRDFFNYCFDRDSQYKSFIFTKEEKILGISLIECKNNLSNLQKSFDVNKIIAFELHKSENKSVIKHLILNPIYHSHALFFVHDIMRLADLTSLYYVNNPIKVKGQSSMLTVLGEFFPIRPIRKVRQTFRFAFLHLLLLIFHSKQNPVNKLYALFQAGLENFTSFINVGKQRLETPFSLYLLSPKLCGFKKLHMNIVIVIVGISQTSLAFLESLIFGPSGPYIKYHNLICVTPQGLDVSQSDIKDFMFPVKDYFTRKYVSMLALDKYVSFMYGIMTEINRVEKYIVVNNKFIVRYDYLILTCGLQYFTPIPKAREIVKKTCMKGDIVSSLARFLNLTESKKFNIPKHPVNMFIINSSNDAKYALQTLQLLIQKIKSGRRQSNKKIIVYGHNVQVFLTINTLLKFGIPGDLIFYVEPFPSNTEGVTLFNDFSVDQAVLESLKKCQVNYFMDYFLYDWSLSSDDFITSITFHSKRKQMVVPCLAFFPFARKVVSDVTYKACNNAGLVYDERLIINHEFRTNDKYIYAAGPFTKYSRRYFASDQNHEHFNSAEVGRKLASIIKEKISVKEANQEDMNPLLVPRLKEPVMLHCQLPGEFNYFVIKKPGKDLDLETAYNFYDYGDVLTTGDCEMKNGFGYFRLHLSTEGFVESITCYTKDTIDYMNLLALYGKHERLLNNVLQRYDLALVNDFYEYFREPWALAIYHRNFQTLGECNEKAFHKQISGEKEKFYDELVKQLDKNKWQSLPESIMKQLEKKYRNSNIEEEIRNNVIEFLEFFKRDLPVYATIRDLKPTF